MFPTHGLVAGIDRSRLFEPYVCLACSIMATQHRKTTGRKPTPAEQLGIQPLVDSTARHLESSHHRLSAHAPQTRAPASITTMVSNVHCRLSRTLLTR
jgi:hypothetical protein